MSIESGKNSERFTAGYGVFHPRASCQRMRLSFSLGAASGASNRMRADAQRRHAALRRVRTGHLADLLVHLVERLRRHERGVGCEVRLLTGADEAGAHVGGNEVERRLSAGRPSISSIVFTMLGWL